MRRRLPKKIKPAQDFCLKVHIERILSLKQRKSVDKLAKLRGSKLPKEEGLLQAQKKRVAGRWGTGRGAAVSILLITSTTIHNPRGS